MIELNKSYEELMNCSKAELISLLFNTHLCLGCSVARLRKKAKDLNSLIINNSAGV